MRQQAYACLAEVHQPEEFRQESSKQQPTPDNLHEYWAHEVSRYPERTYGSESRKTLKSLALLMFSRVYAC